MGLMFTLVGLILTLFGAATMGSPIYDKSLGIDANLYWGMVLLLFGGTMYILGRRGQRKAEREPQKPLPPDTGRRGH
jgi:hypothetical protein